MDIIEHKAKKLYKFKLGASSFLVDIENGAKLLGWDISIAGSKRDIIYYEEDSEFSGNPILFPFAGTCSIKGEKFKWQNPQGTTLDMPQHGFAKDAKFEIITITESNFCAKLIKEDSHNSYYPYNYDFYVAYSFTQFSFSVELRLENHSDTEIPWSAGNHFYFKLPWHQGCSRADYLCKINAKSAFSYQDCFLKKQVPLKTFDLANDSIINLFHCNLRSPQLTFGSKNGEENISIKFLSEDILDKNTSFLTWTKDETSPFFCIEAWMGLANATEHKKGLHFVPALSSNSFIVEVSL